MTATVRQIRPAPAEDLPRITTPVSRKPSFEWEIQSAFYPHLAVQPRHTRRCTSCGYHGPMRKWFRYFKTPWLMLLAVIAASLTPGLLVLLVPQVENWVAFYGNPVLVGAVLLALAALPVGSFLLRYATSYKCPHCAKVGENH